MKKELTAEQAAELVALCQKFVADQHINCAEAIYQQDNVIENAYDFLQEVCDLVGYHEYED